MNDKIQNDDIENIDNESVDNENVDNENVDNENVDNENVDNENVDNEDFNLDDDGFTYHADDDNNNQYGNSLIYIIIGVIILAVIIIVLFLVANRGKSKFSYASVEEKMVSAAKSYIDKNSDVLANGVDEIKIDASTLIEGSYLKPFSEMVSSNVSCSGYVIVNKSETDNLFFPYLNCGEKYTSSKLNNKIISNSLVDSGDGLYKVSNEYIFKGEYPNNYVSFDKKLWRIIKMNDDGTLKLLLIKEDLDRLAWDDRYNVDTKSYSGVNDFRVSRILEYLKDAYEKNKFVSKKNTKYLVKSKWCIGKVYGYDGNIDSLNLCNDVYDDLYIGIVNVLEIVQSSLDKNCNSIFSSSCTNYNYFTYNDTGWTLNASGSDTKYVYVGYSGLLDYDLASRSFYIRPVININANISCNDGSGTKEDPYIIGD